MNKLKEIWKKFSDSPHTWWLDVVLPLLLCTLMFTGVSYLIYSGKKNETLAAITENKLLSLSLIYSGGREVKNPDNIVIVNFPEFETQEEQNIIDQQIDSYAKVITSLANQGVEMFYLKPMHGASTEAYSAFLKVYQRIPSKPKLIFTGIPREVRLLPDFFTKHIIALDSSSCKPANFSVCSYKTAWNDWIHQNLITTFWDIDSAPPDSVVTENLPTQLSSYLLHLNKKDDFDYINIREVNQPIKLQHRYKVAFMGHYDFIPEQDSSSFKNALIIGAPFPDLSNGKNRRYEYDNKTRVLTNQDIWRNADSPNPTPHHIYWAQIAQMFMDNDPVFVTSASLTTALSIMFAVLIIAAIAILGTPISLGLFLMSIMLSSILNAMSIRYWNYYTPCFDAIFAGGSAFLFTSFGKLSYNAFQTWRFAMQENINSEITHLKDNFISLISHNLNTPVSKMQGMLDLLSALSPDEVLKKDVSKANHYVGTIQLSIKSVLVNTAINEKNLSYDFLNLNHITQEFQSVMMPIVKRMGINATIEHDKWDELGMIPLRFNKRALVTFLGCLVGLNQKSTGKIPLHLSIEENESLDQKFGSEILTVEMSTRFIESKEILLHILDPYYEDASHEGNSQSVDKEVFLKLIRAFCQYQEAKVSLDQNTHKLRFILMPSIKPEPSEDDPKAELDDEM